VHLTAYPDADKAAIDSQLLDEMAATREAVTLGLSARRTASIKVRQPLGLCELVLSSDDLRPGLEKHIELIKSELNVKEVAFTGNPDEYVSFELKPNFKILGPRLGKKVKLVGKALAQGDTAVMCAELQDGTLTLELDGESVELTNEDVDIRLTPKEGFAAAQGRHMVAVISTEITEELRQEGWVREFIRCVQDIRKEQELAYDARVEVAVKTDHDELAGVLSSFEDKISGEVLADAFVINGGAAVEGKEIEIDDFPATVSVTSK
jgi:isoleucyl-tRNA synthetase